MFPLRMRGWSIAICNISQKYNNLLKLKTTLISLEIPFGILMIYSVKNNGSRNNKENSSGCISGGAKK